jgi:4-aminobutyrate aminotransferase-like enzyme/Ser/Thr protein kinase RdoA (MazF antagonist)
MTMMETADSTLTALATRQRAFPSSHVARIARDLFGIDGMPRMLYGERDQNFHIAPAQNAGIILKIVDHAEDQDVIDLQIACLQHVARADPSLPVPRVVLTRDGRNRALVEGPEGASHIVYALSFLDGAILEETRADGNLLNEIGRILARLGLALRNFGHPAAGRRIAWDPRHADVLRRHTHLIEAPEIRRLAERALDRFIANQPRLSALRAQIIHHDCHPGNLLVDRASGTVAGILDFGDIVHGPLVFDLAVSVAEISGEGLSWIESARALVSGYRSIQPLEAAEYDVLYDAIVARYALTLAIHAWRSRHDPDGAEKLVGYCASCAPLLEKLMSDGPEKTTAALRDAGGAGQAVVKPAGDLFERRSKVLGRQLELSYGKPVHAVRGAGVFLWEPDGSRLLDAYNNVPSVGHAHPEVVAAIARQAGQICSNTRYLHETVVAYAERLTRTMPQGLSKCIFVNSGSEANDTAWRIAKAVTGKTGAIIIANAYHGITDAVAALSPYSGPMALPTPPHVETLEPPDGYRGRFRDHPDAARLYAADVDRAIDALAKRGHGVAAFFIDSALTAHGILDAPENWLALVAEKIQAAGGLVVGDEVQSGFGRCGDAFWGFATHGIVPDLVTMGKPMANGHPVGAVVMREDIHAAFTSRVDFFSTFGGNPVSAAAALATLDVMERDRLQENCRTTGARFRDQIRMLSQRHAAIGDVRGRGLMIGVDIVADRLSREAAPREARRIANRMRDLGVLVGVDGPFGNVLKIRPPMPFNAEHADMAVEAMSRAMAD